MRTKFAYIPALIIIIGLCASLAGYEVYLTTQTMARITKVSHSDQSYQQTLQQLQNEENTLRSSQEADKSYNNYFNLWAQKEGAMNESKLTARFQKIAEDLGVTIVDSGASAAGMEAATPGAAAGAARSRAARTPRRMPTSMNPGMPGMQTGPDGMVSAPQSVKVNLIGPFPRLLDWISQLEQQVGSVRVTQTVWSAHTPEEVKLMVEVQYKPLRGAKTEGAQ